MFSIQERQVFSISKAEGKNVTGIVKIVVKESSVRGVGVCGGYHNTFWFSEDLILLRPACWKDL